MIQNERACTVKQKKIQAQKHMDEYDIRNFLKYFPQIVGLRPKKYLFVHIPKNGGMSIRHSPKLKNLVTIANRRRLKSKAYADALRKHMTEARAHPGFEHARLKDINTWVRRSHIPFAVVRNPWSRVFSRFMFAIQTRNWDFATSCNVKQFEEFLEERYAWEDLEFSWHRAVRGWHQQRDYLAQEDGSVIPNVLRQEALSDDVKRFFNLSEELERVNVTTGPRVSYKDFYTDKSIQIVADWYADDIATFDFDFDGMARKNVLYPS